MNIKNHVIIVNIMMYIVFVLAFILIIIFLIKRSLEKSLANKIINKFYIVKTVIWAAIIPKLTIKYHIYDTTIIEKIAACIANEIFGAHSEDSLEIMEQYSHQINEELSTFGMNFPELRQIITDALRCYAVAYSVIDQKAAMEWGMINLRRNLDKGILIPGGDMPNPNRFCENADEYGLKYGVLKYENDENLGTPNSSL